MLRLEGGPPLPALRLAGGGGVVEGQEVAFTGFPIGAVLGMTPVTHRGIVSAITPIAIPQANSRDLNPALLNTIATEISLGETIQGARDLIDGKIRGRLIVDVNR